MTINNIDTQQKVKLLKWLRIHPDSSAKEIWKGCGVGIELCRQFVKGHQAQDNKIRFTIDEVALKKHFKAFK